MKTKLISMVVAVALIVGDFSVVLAMGIPVRRPRWKNYEQQIDTEKTYQLAAGIPISPWNRRRNYETQVPGTTEQIAYIFLTGGNRRRNYERGIMNNKQLAAAIIVGGGWRRKNYEGVTKEEIKQVAYIILGGGTRRRNYEAMIEKGIC